MIDERARALALRYLDADLAPSCELCRLGPSVAWYFAQRNEALVELGVLTAAEQRDWDARQAGAVQDGATAPALAAERVGAVLAQALDQAADPGRGDATERRERFGAIVHALLCVGALDHDAASAWTERLEQAVPNPATPLTGPQYHGDVLRGVAVAGDRRRGGLRINSVEFYDDCTIVRWHLAIDDDGQWRATINPLDRVHDLLAAHGISAMTDDLGTHYTIAGEPWGEPDTFHHVKHPGVLPGATAFVPAVSPQARCLRIDCPAGRFQIEVAHTSN